jgi:diphthine synthase
MGACASCGLPLYQYGYTVSIPYFEENWKPDSFYSRIKYNLCGDMHTLCLLDIKVKEPNYESMMKYGKLVYMPPRFMTVSVYRQIIIIIIIIISIIIIIITIIIIINLIMIINQTKKKN